MKKSILFSLFAVVLMAGCGTPQAARVSPLSREAWEQSVWLSVPNASIVDFKKNPKDGQRAADGTSWFGRAFINGKTLRRAVWMTAGLGVYDVYVNGVRVGDDFLKPGFTHNAKTKYSFTYDITSLLDTEIGAHNELLAEVSAGWWRDKIVNFFGTKSAFRGVLRLTYIDGSIETIATDSATWKAGIAGPVTHAAIFDGEEYDARRPMPLLSDLGPAEVNTEFSGAVLPTSGAEVTLRRDLAVLRGPFTLKKGDNLVIDFGQNCAAVPEFVFRAPAGTVLTALPGEMLNDADKGSRGSDGPKGSVYRQNLRCPKDGMRVVYTFAAGDAPVTYHPRFSFFGYRYLSISATDDVAIDSITQIPVTSISHASERGQLATGCADVNKLISNTYWGQLSNYLSVPTDCPQRNERLGWAADTQVFCETASFNADVLAFLRKWMRDMRDSQHDDGAFPSVAPLAQYGNEGHRFGWGDAGVIVPYTMWLQYGDTEIVRENYDAMARFVAMLTKDNYRITDWQYADWVSFEDFEPHKPSCYKHGKVDTKDDVTPESLRYWNFLSRCYLLNNQRMMSRMAAAIDRLDDARAYAERATATLASIRRDFIDPSDGRLDKTFRHLQGGAIFALKFGIIADAAAREATKADLRANFAAHDGCNWTGFLGTSIIMDALTQNNMVDAAYALLLNHNFPSWLYSVDQGATTIWERWNSYTKKDGFGPVSMNSFNHYAYGAVVAWIYRVVAGISADPLEPGFKNIIMAPQPDRRLGFVTASYQTPRGLVKSAWRYEGKEWIWDVTIPEGATATITLPGEALTESYPAGTYTFRRQLP